MDLVRGACRTHGGECNAAYNAKTLPIAGAQFNQNRTNVVKLTLHCDTADTVGYSARRVCQERYTFTHDSILPTIILTQCATALGPHNGWAWEDTL
jgi:hypothetical protein